MAAVIAGASAPSKLLSLALSCPRAKRPMQRANHGLTAIATLTSSAVAIRAAKKPRSPPPQPATGPQPHVEIRHDISDALLDPRLDAVARAFGLIMKRLYPSVRFSLGLIKPRLGDVLPAHKQGGTVACKRL